MVTINPKDFQNVNVNNHFHYIVLDIETGNPPIEVIENRVRTFERNFTGIGNTKDQSKIIAQKQKKIQEIRTKGALFNFSPIVCITVATATGRIIFNGMDDVQYDIEGAICYSGGNEAGMLTLFRAWLDTLSSEDAVLVGHNLKNFDLPKLRHAFIRNRLKLPLILTPGIVDGTGTLAVDTMHLFKAFSMEHRQEKFIKLSVVADNFDIPHSKSQISGADVPGLVEKEQYETILKYCLDDVIVTEKAFLYMTGVDPQLK